MSEPYSRVVDVELATRSYQIGIGNGSISNLDQCIQNSRQIVVITDRTVNDHYAHQVSQQLQSIASKFHCLTVDDGETSKSIDIADRLWQEMVEHGVDRRALVVALGGGVVGDLAGFVAATYLRGIDLVQIPTSLLAQVDSSVGGKVGVNLPQGKNLIGAFWQPKHVVIDPGVLKTLDVRQFRAGMAEVIKYAVILSGDFFAWLESHADAINEQDPAALEEMIARCCQFKADVVAEDERETTGRRAILNYGHTLGHAIEAVCGYGTFLHGEAVAIGMDFAMSLALKLGRVDASSINRQRNLLQIFGLPFERPDADPADLLAAMYHDKKTTDSELNFILPDRIGHVELIRNIDAAQIEALLTA